MELFALGWFVTATRKPSLPRLRFTNQSLSRIGLFKIRDFQEHFDRSQVQEEFAMLVAARVNQIRSGKAKPLKFEKAGGIYYTTEQENLLFADTIARAVCANLDTGEEK